MRRIDKEKSIFGKAAKTINFEKIVLQKLEERAKEEKTNVSSMVNMLCRQKILKSTDYYRELAKHHYLKFQEFNFMKEQNEIQITTR